jgi:hypothetical protein
MAMNTAQQKTTCFVLIRLFASHDSGCPGFPRDTRTRNPPIRETTGDLAIRTKNNKGWKEGQPLGIANRQKGTPKRQIGVPFCEEQTPNSRLAIPFSRNQFPKSQFGIPFRGKGIPGDYWGILSFGKGFQTRFSGFRFEKTCFRFADNKPQKHISESFLSKRDSEFAVSHPCLEETESQKNHSGSLLPGSGS